MAIATGKERSMQPPPLNPLNKEGPFFPRMIDRVLWPESVINWMLETSNTHRHSETLLLQLR